MRSKEYQRKLIKKVNNYKRSRRHFIIGSRICNFIGLAGLLSVIIGYMIYSDTSAGISSIPFETSLMISFVGFTISAISVCIGLNLQNEADTIQSKINRISRMIIR